MNSEKMNVRPFHGCPTTLMQNSALLLATQSHRQQLVEPGQITSIEPRFCKSLKLKRKNGK